MQTGIIYKPCGQTISSMLGTNVGGIPGTENPYAFTLLCVLLVVLAAFLIWLFRKKHWI